MSCGTLSLNTPPIKLMQELLVPIGNLPQKDLNLLLTMMWGIRPRQGQMPKQITPPLSEKTRFLWGNISPKFSHKGADMLSGRVRFGTIGPRERLSEWASGAKINGSIDLEHRASRSLAECNTGARQCADWLLAGVRVGCWRLCGLVAGGCADWLLAGVRIGCWWVC